MLLSPLTTSTPPLSLPARKKPSTKLPTTKPVSSSALRPTATRSTSSSSVPHLASHSPSKSASSSAAITIPSPPLSPHLGYENDKSHKEEIFSARFRDQDGDEEQVDDELSLSRHSSSAPSAMSPLEMRAVSSTPTGFTFSSNITSSVQSKKDRESYEYFLNTMEEDYWKSVSTIRTTYFFDGIGRGGGFLAIPHLASHGNAKTNVICRMLEAWLTEKLVEPTISDSIPVLEDNIQSSVQSIEQHLRQDPKVWSGISKSFIHIRCGHVFMLDTCCDDETIVHLGADEFYQDYPLFVDVEIKMHCDSNHLSKDHSTEILIAFQNVVNKNRDRLEEKPYIHRFTINESNRRHSVATNKAVVP
ncbi:hypothetical protein EMPS_03614 [Entomortierella parvispora]|uniref:Uncharacterized protein n=1 Tax=Entomortierella parvispora TaxID=205924 RepID=A0A9P3H6X9_9FUNG|nr:hypothetical protein EMPS_03614 [Entomortierella parvispora]